MVKNRLHAPLKKYHGKITESELGATKKIYWVVTTKKFTAIMTKKLLLMLKICVK
jgi:hypothetical protein